MNKKNMQILVIDFYDSFTYNIVSDCQRLLDLRGVRADIQVCLWDELNFFLDKTKDSFFIQAIIWGPGPGLVEDYKSIYPLVMNFLNNSSLFNLGICLGHQMLLACLGHDLIQAKDPKHGESIIIRLPPWDIYPIKYHGELMQVQLYHSWVVKKRVPSNELEYLYYKKEILGAKGKNLLTYQFHPESIGTSFPEIFFLPLIDFLCNNGSK